MCHHLNLYGLQKMTLLDYPGRVACTVFLEGCDFRCPFCHNYELATGSPHPLIEEDEFFSFLEQRRGILDGVAITGGEPCLHSGLPEFLKKIRSLGLSTKLDTNGYHPSMLKTILEEGLADYVAMDIKNSPEKYPVTSGLPDLNIEAIRESVSILMACGIEYEFRTTVVRELHETSDFEKIGKWINGAKRFYLQPFTDRETVPFGNLHAQTKNEQQEILSVMRRYVADSSIR